MGTRTRFRACPGGGECGGPSFEKEYCEANDCPSWSYWTSWSDCPVTCDGGRQIRTRQCDNGEEGDCPGSATDEQMCNNFRCGQGMLYYYGWSADPERNRFEQVWQEVNPLHMPAGDTFLERCALWCMSKHYCTAVNIRRREFDNAEFVGMEVYNRCDYTRKELQKVPLRKSNSFDDHGKISFKCAVKESYIAKRPVDFKVEPNGIIGEYEEIKGKGPRITWLKISLKRSEVISIRSQTGISISGSFV